MGKVGALANKMNQLGALIMTQSGISGMQEHIPDSNPSLLSSQSIRTKTADRAVTAKEKGV